MKFIVDRAKWYRGQGELESKLCRTDGKMCCIGFVGEQSGISKVDLLNVASIQSCKISTHRRWPRWMVNDIESVHKAYLTNDDLEISDDIREAKLKEIFAAEGDEIEFVGETV